LGRLVLGLTFAITEVAGPLVPPTRCSSLPMRAGDTPTAAAGAEQAVLEVTCNMAQAFEFPRAGRQRSGDVLLPEPFRSPLRSGPTAGQQQYGLAIGSLQARKHPPDATCGGPIPARAMRPSLAILLALTK